MLCPSALRNIPALYNNNLKNAKENLQYSISLTREAKENLTLLCLHAIVEDGKLILPASSTLTIFSDASNSGWGALSGNVKMGGPWTLPESTGHINEFEILAALKGLETRFTPFIHTTSLELRLDNTSAVSFINCLGGCKLATLCSVALRIVTWNKSRKLELHAIFLTGTANILTDIPSRRLLETENYQ